MRAVFLIAGAALTLSACGGGGNEGEGNTLVANNLVVDGNADADAAANLDANLDANLGASATGNAAVDANTQNAMAKDLTTNEPDTNLANGL